MKTKTHGQVDALVDTSDDESVNAWRVAIGGRIKHARQALGMTQEELAEAAGAKSKSGLQDNERGRSMPGGFIIGALAARGVNTNWIFTGSGDWRQPSGDYQQGADIRPIFTGEPQSSQKADTLDPLLLQQVVDFFYRWLDGHQVRIARNKHGAVISVLYRIAKNRGAVVEDELAQVLGVAA